MSLINYAGDQMTQPLPPVHEPIPVQPLPPEVKLTADDAKLYKSTMLSCRYIFKNGKVAHFVNGRFATHFPAEIAEIDFEISLGNPHFYFDPEEPTVKSVENALMAGIKQAHFREFLALQAQGALDPEKFMGTSVQGPLNAASTSDISPVAAGGGPVGGKINMLAIKK